VTGDGTTRSGAAGARVGIDVGGTFTDLVLSLEGGAQVVAHKEPSTPDDPARAVLDGLDYLLEAAKLAPEALAAVVHGTTLGLNTLLQRKGVTTALIVSTGNRDVLELGRAKMPSPYDFSVARETPLVPRRRVFEIDARLDAAGAVAAEPTQAELDRVCAEIRESGAEAVSLCLLNGFRDPGFEDRIAQAIAGRLPDLPVTRSARVWPEIREYERATLATMNAYLQPPLEAYFTQLQERLSARGIAAPVYITTSNGGTIDLRTAAERPIETLLSGPASGVVAAAMHGQAAGARDLLTVDMGGTSSDMAVVLDGAPAFTTATHVADFPFVAPVIGVSAIGAGGGSVVRADAHGLLKVGPDSAGADPGPACYGLGSTEATLTDCYVVLGLLDPERFLDGRLPLDPAAAESALAQVAAELGIAGPEAAQRVAADALAVATSGMATELGKAIAQRGLDPRRFTLLAYGGAGPTQAALLAQEAGVTRVLVPPRAATFCAGGAVMSDLKRNYIATLRLRLDAPDAQNRIAGAAEDLRGQARDWLAAFAGATRGTTETLIADMRYAGQAFDLPVEVSDHLSPVDLAALTEGFHAVHADRYGFRDPESAVELINLRLRATGRVGVDRLPDAPAGTSPEAAERGRELRLGGRPTRVPVLRRDSLAPGRRRDGPLLIEQSDTTVLVPEGWRVTLDRHGNLDLAQAAADAPADAGAAVAAASSALTSRAAELEVFRNRATAATEEMGITLQRAGRTLYVKETADYGTALATPQGKFFAFPVGVGVAGFVDLDCGPTIARLSELAPGDVVITNHPYASGGLATHTPDIQLLRPYFAEGEIVAWGWCFIHSADIGGKVPSSVSPTNTELYQEGLLIPPTRLVRAGKINTEFLELYRANCRTPDLNVGDLHAMLAALEVGAQRVAGMVARHGHDGFLARQRDLIGYAEAKGRAAFRHLPDGHYSFADYLDNDGFSPVPVRIQLDMQVRDGTLDLDYTLTDPQTRAPFNVASARRLHPWLTLRFLAYAVTRVPDCPVNSGVFRNLSGRLRKGTLVDPEFPAPTGVRAAAGVRCYDVVNGVLAGADPGFMPGAAGGNIVPLVLVEPTADGAGDKVTVVQFLVGAMGGRAGADGVDGRDPSFTNMANNPIETIEAETSVQVLHYGLRPDSGGAGTWRGGCGQSITFRVLVPGCRLLARGLERLRFPPWGLAGGEPGAPARVLLNPGTDRERDLGKLDVVELSEGDVVAALMPGAGGYGPPAGRDPARVAADVADGLVSAAAAAEVYRVTLTGDLSVDAAATRRARAGLRRDPDMGAASRFAYGAERDAWERVFTPARMARMNAALGRLPLQRRQARRAALFAAVHPELAADGRNACPPFTELLADAARARQRLDAEIAALEREAAQPADQRGDTLHA
jgi:N-methylhydantoinase A/oxoprolinase/acetone carboxylase beta subunit/N-methylhydantoinase B/oxoprolinase/acetone carboxylase alpha subunit